MRRFRFYELAATIGPDNPGEAWLVGEASGLTANGALLTALREHGEPNEGTFWTWCEVDDD